MRFFVLCVLFLFGRLLVCSFDHALPCFLLVCVLVLFGLCSLVDALHVCLLLCACCSFRPSVGLFMSLFSVCVRDVPCYVRVVYCRPCVRTETRKPTVSLYFQANLRTGSHHCFGSYTRIKSPWLILFMFLNQVLLSRTVSCSHSMFFVHALLSRAECFCRCVCSCLQEH